MTHDEKISRIKELSSLLNEASRAYYQEGREIMPNIDYDRYYDELLSLENETGFRLSNSPTQNVGYEIISELPKERHPSPMLSLDKTKDPKVLKEWMNKHECVLSWKLDGITCVLTYENGKLTKAVTRGNGEIGEVVTPNARNFINLPATIAFKGRLVIRGEAVISYSDFNKINEKNSDTAASYKNPRNLCSGSVRQLDPRITAERHVRLIVFTLVSVENIENQADLDHMESPEGAVTRTGNTDVTGKNPGNTDATGKNPGNTEMAGTSATGARLMISLANLQNPDIGGTGPENQDVATALPDFHNSFQARFDFLTSQGFEVVEHVLVTADTLDQEIERFKEKIPSYDIPSDGLVLAYEDVAYGLSLGRTAKFPRNSIAFKWQDELAKTTLRYIDWSGSRTGLINPVAVFDPVELEGTTVRRASVHNVSIVKELKLGIGDTITVYKSNMIIPQINENLTKSGNIDIPDKCPVCGGKTKIRHENAAELLYCTNPDCPAKKIKSFALLVSRDALNIEGLSEMTLEKLIDEGFIKEYADLFKLDRYRSEIASLDGFGEKSADNLISAAENSRETDVYRFLYGLGVPGIGLSGARAIAKYFNNDPLAIIHADMIKLKEIKDIGDVLASNFTDFFEDEKNLQAALSLLDYLHFRKQAEDENEENKIFSGKTFVITGDVHHYKNRRELSNLIESLGGKATGSVSSKTDYLINNNVLSSSEKNKKAKELNIPIISEENFIDMLPLSLRP